MNNVDLMLQHAEQHCKTHGTRLTVKRKRVLVALIQSNKVLSAYELLNFCTEYYGQPIPAMSVYRILVFLEHHHLVHKLNLAKKYIACANISCHRGAGISQFLICSKCSKVKEISVEPSMVAKLQSSIEQIGFKLTSPQLEISCLCDDCVAEAA